MKEFIEVFIKVFYMQFIKAMDLQEVYINTYAAKMWALVKTLKEKEKSERLQTYQTHSFPNRFKQ